MVRILLLVREGNRIDAPLLSEFRTHYVPRRGSAFALVRTVGDRAKTEPTGQPAQSIDGFLVSTRARSTRWTRGNANLAGDALATSGDIASWWNVRDYSIAFDPASWDDTDWNVIKGLFRETTGALVRPRGASARKGPAASSPSSIDANRS